MAGFDPVPGVVMADYTAEARADAVERPTADLPAAQAAARAAAPVIRARHRAVDVMDGLVRPRGGPGPDHEGGEA